MKSAEEKVRELLQAHAAECEECAAEPLPVDRLVAVLAKSEPALDCAALSRAVLAAARPELQRRAAAAFRRQVLIAVLIALVPLPAVLLYDAYALRIAYELISTLLPTALAAYVVLSYAAFLLLLFASSYAAIPLLLARDAGGHAAGPA
jgi:hypothetical protein